MATDEAGRRCLIFLLQKVFVEDTVQVTLSSVLDPYWTTKKLWHALNILDADDIL